MNCLKCGREIPAGQVFCGDCLDDMAKFPIKPDTPVQLPVRPVLTVPKHNPKPRRARKPEEQILRLQKITRRLIGALAVLGLLFALFVAAALIYIRQDDKPVIGQNYSTAQSGDSTGETQP